MGPKPSSQKRKGKAIVGTPKKRGRAAPRVPRATLRINEPSDQLALVIHNPDPSNPSREPPPPPVEYADRFVNPKARDTFELDLPNRKVIIEKEVNQKACGEVFVEGIKARGWDDLLIVPEGKLNLTLAREFYANFMHTPLSSGTVKVRGVKVPFSAVAINKHYEADPVAQDEDFRALIRASVEKGEDPLEELRVFLNPNVHWGMNKTKTERKKLETRFWPRHWKVVARFIQNRVCAKDNISHFTIPDMEIVYAFWKGLSIDIGEMIFAEFRKYLKVQHRVLINPHLVVEMCLDAGVKEYTTDVCSKKKILIIDPDEKDDEFPSGATTSTTPTTQPTPPPYTRPTSTPTTHASPSPPCSPLSTMPRIPAAYVVPAKHSVLMADHQRNLSKQILENQNTIITGLKELFEDMRHKPATDLKLPVVDYDFSMGVEDLIAKYKNTPDSKEEEDEEVNGEEEGDEDETEMITSAEVSGSGSSDDDVDEDTGIERMTSSSAGTGAHIEAGSTSGAGAHDAEPEVFGPHPTDPVVDDVMIDIEDISLGKGDAS